MGDEAEQGLNLSVDAPPELEERVRKLEQTVARLEDTSELEERITTRVTTRLQQVAPTQTASTDERITSKSPTPPPPPTPDVASKHRARHQWLFVDMVTSARLLPRMFFDHRYRMAWTTHMVVWIFVPAIFLSSWWFPLAWIPVVGVFFDKALDLLLAFCVYKALSRELRRYKEVRGV